MKCSKFLAASLPFLAILSGCGGSSGGGGPVTPPPAVPTPQDPLPITTSNANAVIAVDARLTETLVDLVTLLVQSVVATAESGQTTITLPCDSGDVTVTLTDQDGNGLPGTNESATISANACEDFDLRYVFTGTADVLFRSLVLSQNIAAKGKTTITVSAPMRLSDGTDDIDLSGNLESDFLYDSDIQTLRIYQRFGDEITLETTNADGVFTDVYRDYVITRGLTATNELSKSVALRVESETVVGAFTCSTPTFLLNVLGETPDSGQLQCSGLNNSTARADSMGNGAVDVVADPEGDGSFVDAGILAGGAGNWNDFFATSLFTITFPVPGTIPPQIVVPINSTETGSGGNAINDVAVSPINNNNRLYVSDNSGIRILDAANGTELDSVAIPDRPGPMAVSDDGSVLWFGLQDTAEIQSVTLPNLAPGPRVSLGGSRRALQLRVAPGQAQTVVVSMTNNAEIFAYSNGIRLTNSVNNASAPVTFEFIDGTTMVGQNPVASSHPAAVMTLDASGVTLGVIRQNYDLDSDETIAITQLSGSGAANPAVVSSSGRVYDVIEGTIFGRIKLDQTESATSRDGVAIDGETGFIYVYNSASGLLESYKDTLVLRGAYRLFVEGDFIRTLDAGSRMVFASDSEIHIVNKNVLSANRNQTPCQPFDLSNQIIFGFFVQIDCGVNDVIYNSTQNVLYATLPSTSGVNGNSIVRVDAATGAIVGRADVGSEPQRMVITSDDNRAYITLGESNRLAVVNLSGGTEVLEGYINLRDYNNGNPMFADAIAVSPTDNELVLVGATAHLSAYQDGTRLQNFLGANIGNPKDIFFADGNNAIAQVDDGTLSRVSVGASGVGLSSQASGVAVSGSLKVQDGKIYDHDGRVLDAGSLVESSRCASGVGVPGLLVDPSEVSDLIYYIDASVDSLLSTCVEGNDIPSRTATVPAFGDITGMPRDLEEMGDNRVALTTGDILLLFKADGL